MTTVPKRAGEVEACLGATFRAERKARGVSQGRIAKGLGVSINTVRWHEAGARSMRLADIVRAACIIGCRPEALILARSAAKPSPAAGRRAKRAKTAPKPDEESNERAAAAS